MSNTEGKDKQQVNKDSSQAPNPAKTVNAPKLSVKHEFTLDKEFDKKKENEK